MQHGGILNEMSAGVRRIPPSSVQTDGFNVIGWCMMLQRRYADVELIVITGEFCAIPSVVIRGE